MCVNDDTYIIELRSRDGKTPTGEYEALNKIRVDGGGISAFTTAQLDRYNELKNDYVNELSYNVNSQQILSQLGNDSSTAYKVRVTFFSLFQSTGLNTACIDINVKEFYSGNVLASDSSRGVTLATIPAHEHKDIQATETTTELRPISYFGQGHSWIRVNPSFSTLTVRLQNALSDNKIAASRYWQTDPEGFYTPPLEDYTLRIELVKV